MEVLHYATESNQDPYQEWLDGLRDRLRESQFSGELIGSFSAISGTIKPAAMGCGSFVLISARVIEFTIRDLERRSSCYCVADRNERKPRILIRPSIIGRTISGD